MRKRLLPGNFHRQLEGSFGFGAREKEFSKNGEEDERRPLSKYSLLTWSTY